MRLVIITLFCIIWGCFINTSSFAQNEKYQVLDKENYTAGGIDSIVVYSKPSCSRCAQVIELLDQNDAVSYEVVDLSDTENQQALDSLIYHSIEDKSKGYSIRFPVIVINNDIYYCIDNHYRFIQRLLSLYDE
ncbi:MAG: glutaredoxin domain-containing protein [Bacteroidota bacterium]|nr:glutaredoxin domain-containing protein [Bacteroidota bacterium]